MDQNEGRKMKSVWLIIGRYGRPEKRKKIGLSMSLYEN